MRTLRGLQLALVLLLSYAVLFSTTGKVGKAAYKPCLSRVVQQIKLAGIPKAQHDVASITQGAEPAPTQNVLSLLSFLELTFRDALDAVPSLPARGDEFPAAFSPQRAPFALRV